MRHKYIAGERFGMAVLVCETDKRNKSGAVFWKMKCDCGNTFFRSTESLRQSKRRGCIVSCGCFQREISRQIGKREWWNPKRIEEARKSLGQIDGTTMQGINRLSVNRNNTTGHIGVGWDKRRQKYRARIMIRGKDIELGYYDKLDDAIKARKEGERKYFDPIREEYEEANGKYRSIEKKK